VADSFSGSESNAAGEMSRQSFVAFLISCSPLPCLARGYVDRMVCSQTRNASRTDRKGEGIDINTIALKDQRQIAFVMIRTGKATQMRTWPLLTACFHNSSLPSTIFRKKPCSTRSLRNV